MTATERELYDLTRTAVDRVRKAVGLVTRLLDDDEQIAAVLLAVAADLLVGSAAHLYASDEDMSKEEALGHSLKGFLATIGVNEIKAAIMATPEKKQCGG